MKTSSNNKIDLRNELKSTGATAKKGKKVQPDTVIVREDVILKRSTRPDAEGNYTFAVRQDGSPVIKDGAELKIKATTEEAAMGILFPAPASLKNIKARVVVTDEQISEMVEAGQLFDIKSGSKVVDVEVKNGSKGSYYACKLEDGTVRSWNPDRVLTYGEVRK